MKTAVLLAFFFLLAVTTGDQLVYDTDSEPVKNGGTNYILPGFTYAGDPEKCPLAVVQSPFDVPPGVPFDIASPINFPFITTEMPLNISFTQAPPCSNSSKWFSVESFPVGWPVKVGIDEEKPKGIVKGEFYIKQHELAYKLVFCLDEDAKRCGNIGVYTHNDQIRRLIVKEGNPLTVKFRKVNEITSA